MRLAGVNIPDNKHISVALTYIYGVGKKVSADICKKASVSGNVLVKNITNNELNRISSILSEDYVIEGELRKIISMNIKLLIDIGSYRGRRHYNRLPVRGQRTHTNARTRKGKAIAIAGKKKLG